MTFTQGYFGLPQVWYTGSNYLHLSPEPGTVTIADIGPSVSITDASCFITPFDYQTSIKILDF